MERIASIINAFILEASNWNKIIPKVNNKNV